MKEEIKQSSPPLEKEDTDRIQFLLHSISEVAKSLADDLEESMKTYSDKRKLTDEL